MLCHPYALNSAIRHPGLRVPRDVSQVSWVKAPGDDRLHLKARGHIVGIPDSRKWIRPRSKQRFNDALHWVQSRTVRMLSRSDHR